MNPEVLLPQSAAVQAFGYGLAVGALLFGLLGWFWAHAHGWDAGFAKGHAEGWIKGMSDVVKAEGLTPSSDSCTAAASGHDGRRAMERRREGRQ